MKVKKETIIRLVVLVIVLVNQVLCSTGKINFELAEEQVYELISIFATIIVSGWTAWKNNSVTKEAIKADEYLKELKKGSEEEC